MNLFWKESETEYDGHIQTEISRTIDGDCDLVIRWKIFKFAKKIRRDWKHIFCPDFRSASKFSSGQRATLESGEFKFIGRMNHAKIGVITNLECTELQAEPQP